jgi:hypothetical protein
MAKWIRAAVVGVLMAAAAGAGVAIGGVAQEPDPMKVLITNRAHQAVPVEGVVTQIRRPVVLDDRTTVALKEGTVVKIAPPVWEYRELRVPTTPGNQSSILGALAAAGTDGWETTGLSFTSPGFTIIVMKRPR